MGKLPGLMRLITSPRGNNTRNISKVAVASFRYLFFVITNSRYKKDPQRRHQVSCNLDELRPYLAAVFKTTKQTTVKQSIVKQTIVTTASTTALSGSAFTNL